MRTEVPFNKRARLLLQAVLRWYVRRRPGDMRKLPFYADSQVVGHFAVDLSQIAAGAPTELFRLFILLSMYQGLRDVVVARRQQSLPYNDVLQLASLSSVSRSVRKTKCTALSSPSRLLSHCYVFKTARTVGCSRHPSLPCPVKGAVRLLNRTALLGKLPSSAWLTLWRDDGLRRLLDTVARSESNPQVRAALLVDRIMSVAGVGRKLAAMFVSELSTPALRHAPTPWHPLLDGNDLVVVDTNVARLVDRLAGRRLAKTYKHRENWLRRCAASIDLSQFDSDLPVYSPRIVQESLYAFGSKSNRTATGDPCAGRARPCETCAPSLCPLVDDY